MEAFVVTWRELLIVVIAVLAVYVIELVLVLRWSGKVGSRWWRREAAASVDRKAIDDLNLEVAELRKQFVRLQSEVDKVKSTPAQTVSPYNLAIQMARQGASANDVASGCGISRGEAELIVALYRKLRI